GCEYDERLDHVASGFVGRRDHGRVCNRAMPHETVLDFRGSDAVARCLEHIVGAALVPEGALAVALRQIARAAPVAGELRRRALGVAEVLEEEHGGARAGGRNAVHRNLADLAVGNGVAIVVDDLDPMPRVWTSHRPGPRWPE